MKINKKGTWRGVADAARNTVGKLAGSGEPSDRWKKRMLLAEHSPIRKLSFGWTWRDLMSWVSVHFVRHKYGIEHFVQTQRSDRAGGDRNSARQDAKVSHEAEANAQAMISISRKRLCFLASKETQQAWREVKRGVEKEDPVLASVMVPECIYRGFCPEFTPCGYSDSAAFQKRLNEYRRVV